MAIIRLQHIGLAVKDINETCTRFERIFGLRASDQRNDQDNGMQQDARILLGNDCWLHVVQNGNPASPVYQFLQRHGEGLEHLALETDNMQAEVQRLREVGVSIVEERIFDSNDGYHAYVRPEDAIGFTVELIQPHKGSWGYPAEAKGQPVSDKMGIIRLQHFGIVVKDHDAASKRFAQLFGLKSRDFRNDQGRGMQFDSRVLLGNECWMHIVQNWNPESRVYQFLQSRGEMLEHIALQTTTMLDDVQHLNTIKTPIYNKAIFNAPDGYESFIYPTDGVGFTIELIQPHPTSWGYPRG